MKITAATGHAAVRAFVATCLIVSVFAPGAAAEPASQPGWAPAGGLDAGVYHTCALLDGGSVRCWGFSGNGQLGYANTSTIGDNETPASVGPVDLGPGRSATAIVTGNFHTCALLDDGNVRCWGLGANGRLGYGNTNDIGDDETPGSVSPVNLGGHTAKAISAGGAQTCAILEDSTVRCWGYDFHGELGYGNTDTIGDNEAPGSVRAVDLGAGRTAKAITTGGAHTCAILDDSTVRCWGVGSSGQLGYGNTNDIGDNESPASHGMFGVACPSATQCTAVDNVGQQVTFNPTAPGTPTPTTIDATNVLNAVACPSPTQCTAVDNGGREVTFSPTAPGTPTPTMIDNSNRLNGVACPAATQCTAADTVGQQITFNPTAPGSPTATQIDNSNVLNGVACPSATQCTAVDSVGAQVTFNPSASSVPAPSTMDSGHVLRGLACPSMTQCTAVEYVGQQVTFNPAAPGTPSPSRLDTAPPVDLGGLGAKAITAGGSHTCAILDDSTVRCWGYALQGQLGYANTTNIGATPATTPNTTGPVDLGPGRSALAISAGSSDTCARLDDQSVRCWGYGANGRLGYANAATIGDDETPGSVGPVDLGPGRKALAVSTGQEHTCARLDDQNVRCWGYGANGRLGYCNQNNIGDDETPGSVGPVDLGVGGASCSRGSPPIPSSPTAPSTSAKKPSTADTDALRSRGLRRCLAAVARHAKRESARARRGSASHRARVRRHLKRHLTSGHRGCLHAYGRTPGSVTGLRAQTLGKTQIQLSFNAAGTDGAHPPPAHSYVIKQSRRPIRGARDFARAQTLCKGSCRFNAAQVGSKVSLTVTDLHARNTYYYAVAARDNVSAHRGPRSATVRVRTP
ncbi:MAG: hypothetical protein M3065_04810 [Actinomycetota bacterium]|nr:hypothetical protein [Actinomycetota bacterium]